MVIQAKDIMHTDVECVRTGMSVGQLAEFLQDRGIRGTPVLNTAGQLVGVVSVSDIVFSSNTFGENDVLLESDFQSTAESNKAHDWSKFDAGDINDIPVEEIMSTLLVSAAPDASLAELAGLMHERHIHRIVIVEDEKLAGIVTTSDILKAVKDGKVS